MSDNSTSSNESLGQKMYKEIVQPFIDITRASKAMLGVYYPYLIEGLVYFGFLTILGKYLSENLGLSDETAGFVYSFVTGGITFAMLVFGGWSDKLGVRKSLLLSFLILSLGRLIVATSGTFSSTGGLTSSMFIVMSVGLLLIIIAYGLFQPAAYAGVKRFSNKQNATMGYAVIYGLMNLGSFASGFVSSFTRQKFEKLLPPNGLTAVFWVFAILTVFSLLLTWYFITKKNDQEAVDQVEKENAILTDVAEESDEPEDESYKQLKINNTFLYIYSGLSVGMFLFSSLVFNVSFNSFYELHLGDKTVKMDLALVLSIVFVFLAFVEYVRKRPYHPFNNSRFTFFVFILIPVQTLFAHNWLTLPYYLDRAFQGTVVSQYFEVFANLNPLLIFLLTPIIAAMTAKADVYKMMIYGTLVMAAPTFLLVIGPNVYLFILYVIGMTIGEAMWSPRFLQWIAEVAPKGKVGLYMGVGQFPWFLDKVITGFYSGYFLNKYCPQGVAPEQLHTGTMWFIYSLIAIITPISLILAKNWMMKGFKKKV